MKGNLKMRCLMEVEGKYFMMVVIILVNFRIIKWKIITENIVKIKDILFKVLLNMIYPMVNKFSSLIKMEIHITDICTMESDKVSADSNGK